MEYMERYRRLVDENARFDFFERLGELARYEEGEDVPQIPREQWDADHLSRHDFDVQCRYYEYAVIASHLGIDERRDPPADVKRVAELASEIYFGEWWQNAPDSTRRDVKYPVPAHEIRSRFFEFWLTDYCYGVLCALVLDDKWTAGRLGCYPGMDLITDDADRGLRRPDILFHYILGSYLRYGDLEDAHPDATRAIREGQSARAKMWLKALRALDKGKPEPFAEAFLEVARHHREHEYSPRLKNGPMTLLMQEGGILWHLARRKGIAPAWETLPIEVSDHLLTIETLTRRA